MPSGRGVPEFWYRRMMTVYRFLIQFLERPGKCCRWMSFQWRPSFWTAEMRMRSSDSRHSLRSRSGSRDCCQRFAHWSALREPTTSATSVHLCPNRSTPLANCWSSFFAHCPFLRPPATEFNHLFRQSLFVRPGSLAAMRHQSLTSPPLLCASTSSRSFWSSAAVHFRGCRAAGLDRGNILAAGEREG